MYHFNINVYFNQSFYFGINFHLWHKNYHSPSWHKVQTQKDEAPLRNCKIYMSSNFVINVIELEKEKTRKFEYLRSITE